MTALLQFMYQGVVNVKHDELPIFMKIAASLQIKGLTAHEEQSHPGGSSHQQQQHHKYSHQLPHPQKDNPSRQATGKRSHEVQHEPYPMNPKRNSSAQSSRMAELLQQVQQQQSTHHHQTRPAEGDSNSEEGTINPNSNMTAEDVLMPAISLTEYPLGGHQVKREVMDPTGSPVMNNGNSSSHNNNNNQANNGNERPLFNAPLKMEFGGPELQAAAAAAYNQMAPSRSILSASSSPLGPQVNDLSLSQDGSFSRSANHMDIPTGECEALFRCNYFCNFGSLISLSLVVYRLG